MNLKKYSNNTNKNTGRGSPNLKENNGINTKYLSLLKNNKKAKIPLKEKSKNSIIFNSPPNNIKEFENKKLSKNLKKYSNENLHYNENKEFKINFNSNKSTNKNKFGSPNTNKIKIFKGNFKGSPNRKTPSYINSPPGSPGSPISPNHIEYILDPNNYNGRIKNLLDGNKVTENCISDNKKSKYYIIENEKVIEFGGKWEILRGVCSKCAVKLANNGFICEEIIEEIKDMRIKRIENFNLYYKNLNISLPNTFNNLNLHLENIKTKKHEQMIILNNTIGKIFNIFSNFKNEIENYINLNYDKEIDGIEKVIEKFSKYENEININYADIENNYDIIINEDQLKQDKFNSIFTEYEKKIIEIFNFNQNINDYKSIVPNIEKGKYIKLIEDLKNNIFNINNEQIQFENNEEDFDYSNNNEVSKSDVVISFDEKHYQSAINLENDEDDIDSHKNSTRKFIKVIDKINSSQKSKNKFYSSILKNNNELEDFKTNISNNLENEKKDEEENKDFFVFKPNDDENWEDKQTPQLGEKEEIPENLKEISNLDNPNREKCHKILFN